MALTDEQRQQRLAFAKAQRDTAADEDVRASWQDVVEQWEDNIALKAGA